MTDQSHDSTPVEKLAIKHNLKVSYYPIFDHSLITKNTLGLCASFDHLLPTEIIQLFAGKLYNLHPSLLPQYRNVSPVQYAIALGDHETGITLFCISAGIDNGQIVAQVSEPILPTDTTPTLTSRLFEKGSQLYLNFLHTNKSTGTLENRNTRKPIFTHRLTRDSGHLEWPILQKLLANQLISPTNTKNELLSLRLGSDLKECAKPAESSAGRSDPHGTLILHDLIRALTPWPGVWTTAPTKKGDLHLSIESVLPKLTVKLAGKPKPISYSDFNKYYL
ncbi:MAG: formyltransferase family protein [bacterium]